MDIKLDQVRTFITVAESGSLNDAAKILSRTPSAISMSLKQFSEQFGGELFETDRKSKLTTLGLFVLEQSRNAITYFDESIETIHRFENGDYGTVKVASVPSFSTRILPDVVERFSKQLPSVNLDLRDMDTDSINHAISSKIIDFGIASSVSKTQELKSELLIEEPFGVVCCNSNSLKQKKQPISWSELQTQKFISNGLSRLVKNPHIEQLGEKSKLHIHNLTTLLSFIRKGFGITLLPKLAVPEHYGFCFLELKDQSVIRRLFILEHKQQRLSPAANLFKKQIKQTMLRVNSH